jgi:hypothetical protein
VGRVPQGIDAGAAAEQLPGRAGAGAGLTGGPGGAGVAAAPAVARARLDVEALPGAAGVALGALGVAAAGAIEAEPGLGAAGAGPAVARALAAAEADLDTVAAAARLALGAAHGAGRLALLGHADQPTGAGAIPGARKGREVDRVAGARGEQQERKSQGPGGHGRARCQNAPEVGSHPRSRLTEAPLVPAPAERQWVHLDLLAPGPHSRGRHGLPLRLREERVAAEKEARSHRVGEVIDWSPPDE